MLNRKRLNAITWGERARYGKHVLGRVGRLSRGLKSHSHLAVVLAVHHGCVTQADIADKLNRTIEDVAAVIPDLLAAGVLSAVNEEGTSRYVLDSAVTVGEDGERATFTVADGQGCSLIMSVFQTLL